MEPMTPGAATAANLNRDSERVRELQAENEQLRSLLWKISESKRLARYDERNDAIAFIEVEGGFTTLDAIDEVIGYDEMGQ